MDSALQTAQKIELSILIRKVSELNGGDDKKELEEYIHNVTKATFNRIGETICYFRDLRSGYEKYLCHDEKKQVKTNLCGLCGLMKPFCKH